MVTIHSPGFLPRASSRDAILDIRIDRTARAPETPYEALAVHVGMAVSQAWHDRAALHVDMTRLRPDMWRMAAPSPTASTLPLPIAIAGTMESRASIVMMCALLKTISAGFAIAVYASRRAPAPKLLSPRARERPALYPHPYNIIQAQYQRI